MVKDQIFSRASGYLKDIRILNESKSDYGTYEVEIEAEVEVAVLVDDIDRFKNVIGWQKNPRIRVIIDPNLPPENLAAAKKSANRLTAKLKQNGFKVYGAESDLQMGLLVDLGVELSTRSSSYQGLELSLNEVALTANIQRPEDGEILATASAVKSVPGENRLQILDQGADQCVHAVWQELRDKLLRVWEKELYSTREISLIVKNVPTHARATEVAGILASDVSGVVAANLVAYRKKTADFQVSYRGWAEQLLNELQMSYFKNRYFAADLVRIAGNQLVISIQ